jgi:signal transduction histidine kinase
MINDLLDYATFDEGKFELKLETFKLHDLIQDTLILIKFQCKEREIDIVDYFQEGLTDLEIWSD